MPDQIYVNPSQSRLGSLPPANISVPSGSGGFNPLSISGLIGWYDFSRIDSVWKDTARTSAITADADIILGVTDLSGAAAHLSEATNGPAYKAASQNGRSICRFDGVNDQLTATISAKVAATYFITVKKATAPTGASKTAFGMGASAQFHTNSGVSAAGWVWFGNQVAANQAIGGTAANMSTIVLRVNSAASMDFYVNGGAGANFDPDNTVTTAVSMTLGSVGGSNFGDYDVAEFLRYDTALALANLNAVGAGLGAKWGLTWSTAS